MTPPAVRALPVPVRAQANVYAPYRTSADRRSYPLHQGSTTGCRPHFIPVQTTRATSADEPQWHHHSLSTPITSNASEKLTYHHRQIRNQKSAAAPPRSPRNSQDSRTSRNPPATLPQPAHSCPPYPPNAHIQVCNTNHVNHLLIYSSNACHSNCLWRRLLHMQALSFAARPAARVAAVAVVAASPPTPCS